MVAEKNKTLATDRIKNQMKRTGINLILILGAVVMLTPAEGPSFGIAPSGKCMWISFVL